MSRPKNWTADEDELLVTLWRVGVSSIEIGRRLGKPAWVGSQRAEMLGLLDERPARTVEELRAFWRPLLPGIAAAAVTEYHR